MGTTPGPDPDPRDEGHEQHRDHTPVTDKVLTQNWEELLQEIRVMQTGVQILTGFLLTLPFTSRFPDLDSLQVRTYLTVLCGAVLTTALVVAPTAFHRVLFRQRERPWLVTSANRCVRAGLLTLALTSCGVLFLVFDVVTVRALAWVVFVVSLLLFAVLWAGLPLWRRGAGDGPADG